MGKIVLRRKKEWSSGRWRIEGVRKGNEAVTASRGEAGGQEVREAGVWAVWVVGPQGMTELLGRASDRK